jgi:hypothetical protein
VTAVPVAADEGVSTLQDGPGHPAAATRSVMSRTRGLLQLVIADRVWPQTPPVGTSFHLPK